MPKKRHSRRTIVAGGLATLAVSAIPGCQPSRNPARDREGSAKNSGSRSSAGSTTAGVLQPIALVLKPTERHWVGDGFRVSTVFSPSRADAQVLSPFILMDHAAPRTFEPASQPRGVGEHPHRGFETVTFAYQGEVAHRDSHGGGGTIGAGDVQWMTAASGVVHEEFHSQEFTESGGVFEMVQLWVNLPARLKMTTPRYQRLLGSQFPKLSLGSAIGRLVAGTHLGETGPAKTHSPMTVFDLEFKDDGVSSFELAPGTTTLLCVLGGDVELQGSYAATPGEVAVLDRTANGAVRLEGKSGARLLVLNGEPLNEPVVARGPFVMNSNEEIAQAIRDYRQGLMGRLQPKEQS